MLAFLITLFTLLMASVQAVSNDVEIRQASGITLPQCGNLTLSWNSGVAPYKAVITDVTNGLHETIRSKTNHLTWTINLAVNTKVSFVVTDATKTASGGGPYKIVYSGETSCLCNSVAKRESEEEPRAAREVSLLERLDIGLPAVSDREASNFVDERGSSWSIKRAMRKHRRGAHTHHGLIAAACPL